MPQHTLDSIRRSLIEIFNQSFGGSLQLTEGPADLLKTMKDLNAERTDIADVTYRLEMKYQIHFPENLKIRYGNDLKLFEGLRVVDIFLYTVKLVLDDY